MAVHKEIESRIELAEATYCQRTAKSKRLNEEAKKYLPGGDTRQACYFKPYPVYMERGEGCMIYDADNNQYVDVLNNYTQQIHGHRHKPTIDAIVKQLGYGTIFGAPHEIQYKLGQLLCERIPSMDKVRFCNSGTEATMIAIKGARAFTKKDKILKFEGMYHGTHDLAEVSVFPSLGAVGNEFAPNSVPSNAGLPQSILDNVIVAPLNNYEVFTDLINKHKDELAAVIMEPIMTSSGVIAAEREFMLLVRELTAKFGIVLIFDEVVTFRLGLGGAQKIFNIIPDMTTIGKFIGGGFPIGAFGGKEEYMAAFQPAENVFANAAQKVKHSGTFNGHPAIMAAGLAAMQSLTADVFENINSLGESLLQKLNNDVFKQLGLHMCATGYGSLLYIHYTDAELKNYRQVKEPVDKVGRLPHLIHMELLNQGVFIAERGEITISTPMCEENVDYVAKAYKAVMENIIPAMKKDIPHLFK